MQMQTVTIPASAAGEHLNAYLGALRVALSAPCGGRGVCGKCRVRVLSGTFISRVTGEPLMPDADGFILACQAVIPPEGGVIAVPDNTGDGLTASAVTGGASPAGRAQTDGTSVGPDGFALDIGTTTLAAARVDRASGETRSAASCLNPQQSFGADVISRIGAARNGQLGDMQAVLLDAVRGLAARLFPEITPDTPEEGLPPMTVAGNATMLHLFCGVSPEGMGAYPFTPAFTAVQHLTGKGLGLPASSVTVLPSVSAFVGGDITAGMLVCGLGSSVTPALLLDIGTNGEMVLDTGRTDGNRLISASTAAGPALEGANISCGLGGVAGAVSGVLPGALPDTLVYRTVGDAPARGICGCGLIDLCARLLDLEVMDETGCLDDDPFVLTGAHETASGLAPGAETPVALSQKDVREVQLAKSALRAGMEALLDAAGLDVETFTARAGRVFIAGGLGYYLDPVSAVRIGLLPPEYLSAHAVKAVGNTSLAGAVRALCDPSAVDTMSALAAACGSIELNRSQVFNDGFIEYMMFPESDEIN